MQLQAWEKLRSQLGFNVWIPNPLSIAASSKLRLISDLLLTLLLGIHNMGRATKTTNKVSDPLLRGVRGREPTSREPWNQRTGSQRSSIRTARTARCECLRELATGWRTSASPQKTCSTRRKSLSLIRLAMTEQCWHNVATFYLRL